MFKLQKSSRLEFTQINGRIITSFCWLCKRSSSFEGERRASDAIFRFCWLVLLLCELANTLWLGCELVWLAALFCAWLFKLAADVALHWASSGELSLPKHGPRSEDLNFDGCTWFASKLAQPTFIMLHRNSKFWSYNYFWSGVVCFGVWNFAPEGMRNAFMGCSRGSMLNTSRKR